MENVRVVNNAFWRENSVVEELSSDERFMYLYLLTNPQVTPIGIYKLCLISMAMDLGFSVEKVESTLDRLETEHQLVRYNPLVEEIALKDWGRYHYRINSVEYIDSVIAALRDVADPSHVPFVLESLDYQETFDPFPDEGMGVDELEDGMDDDFSY